MTEWISVKDRLPESEGRYLVYEKKPHHSHNCSIYNYPLGCCEPNIAYFKKYCNEWEWNSWSEAKCTVTHWMELPERPKEEI